MPARESARIVRSAEVEPIRFGPLAEYRRLTGEDGLPVFTGVQTCAPGYATPLHWHPYVECLFVLEGAMEAVLEGRRGRALPPRAGRHDRAAGGHAAPVPHPGRPDAADFGHPRLAHADRERGGGGRARGSAVTERYGDDDVAHPAFRGDGGWIARAFSHRGSCPRAALPGLIPKGQRTREPEGGTPHASLCPMGRRPALRWRGPRALHPRHPLVLWPSGIKPSCRFPAPWPIRVPRWPIIPEHGMSRSRPRHHPVRPKRPPGTRSDQQPRPARSAPWRREAEPRPAWREGRWGRSGGRAGCPSCVSCPGYGRKRGWGHSGGVPGRVSVGPSPRFRGGDTLADAPTSRIAAACAFRRYGFPSFPSWALSQSSTPSSHANRRLLFARRRNSPSFESRNGACSDTPSMTRSVAASGLGRTVSIPPRSLSTTAVRTRTS